MSNPFDVPEYVNPFDSAAGSYTEPSPYEPPQSPPAAVADAPVYSSYSEPTPAPQAQRSAQPQSSSSGKEYRDPITGFKLTSKDLQKREEELRAREEKIASAEAAIASGTYQGVPFPRNFPPLLRFWKYYPDNDLGEAYKGLMKKVFILYLVNFFVLLLNLIGCLACLDSGTSAKIGSPGMRIGLSAVYWIVFTGLSYEFSYFVLYNAMSKENPSGFRTVLGLICSFIYGCFVGFCAVGWGGGGTVGWICALNLFKTDTSKGQESTNTVAIISLVYSLVQTGVLALWVIQWIVIFRTWKRSGGVQAAQREAVAQGVEWARDHPDQIASAAHQAGEASGSYGS